jgi:hypothetical protein
MSHNFKVTEMEWKHHLLTRWQPADLLTHHGIDSGRSLWSAGETEGTGGRLTSVTRSPHLFGMLSVLR